MKYAIEATGLVKRYKSVVALDGLDLAVPEGTVTGLLGPNGAGKTTAVRIFTTLLVPDAGQARVGGLDVVTDADRLRQVIGLSGQYAAVDEDLTGFENLDMVGRLYHLGRRGSRDRARELLEQFDLVEAADRAVKGYSGGMRRRLDIAGALVARPPLLFLDEPTTGLDLRSRLTVWETIAELVAAGSTLLLTTQYLEEADRLADQIAVIDHGRVIASGTADELKGQVGGERLELTVATVAELPAARATLAPLAIGEVVVDEQARSITVPVAGGAPTLTDGVRRLTEANVRVLEVGLRRPTLDDVFLSLTGHAARDEPPDEDATKKATKRARSGCRQARRGEGPMSQLVQDIGDGMVLAKRNLIKIQRVPDLLVFSTLSPIMFVLLFAYVFGSAIEIPGVSYREFLMAGIFTQTMLFGSTLTGSGLAMDLQRGIVDRFRSLPIARSAVLVGRTTSDLVNNVLVFAVMATTGLIVGWRIRSSELEAIAGFALLLLFAYAFSWVMAVGGLMVRSPEVFNNASFIAIFPLTFIANTFVGTDNLPGPLKVFAEWNPISAVTQASRELFGNTNPNVPPPDAWPLQHPVATSFAWIAVILAIFVPLAIQRYKKAVSR